VVPVRSVILHGSAATGQFVPGQSDIDLLVVVDDALSPAEVNALENIVRGCDLGSASGMDLDVVLTGVAAAPTASPPQELHLGRYPGERRCTGGWSIHRPRSTRQVSRGCWRWSGVRPRPAAVDGMDP